MAKLSEEIAAAEVSVTITRIQGSRTAVEGSSERKGKERQQEGRRGGLEVREEQRGGSSRLSNYPRLSSEPLLKNQCAELFTHLERYPTSVVIFDELMEPSKLLLGPFLVILKHFLIATFSAAEKAASECSFKTNSNQQRSIN